MLYIQDICAFFYTLPTGYIIACTSKVLYILLQLIYLKQLVLFLVNYSKTVYMYHATEDM